MRKEKCRYCGETVEGFKEGCSHYTPGKYGYYKVVLENGTVVRTITGSFDPVFITAKTWELLETRRAI